MPVEIIKFTAKHVDAAAVLEKKCFSAPWSRDMLEGELHNPHAHYIAAVDGETLVGYGGLHLIIDEAYITNIAVAPAFRRSGIGSRLLERMIRYSVTRGAVFLTLEVRVSNLAAQSMYEKLGFEAAGVRRGYYDNPPEDALIMTRYINTGRRKKR